MGLNWHWQIAHALRFFGAVALKIGRDRTIIQAAQDAMDLWAYTETPRGMENTNVSTNA